MERSAWTQHIVMVGDIFKISITIYNKLIINILEHKVIFSFNNKKL